jgi:predicted metal-dependent hydrolase
MARLEAWATTLAGRFGLRYKALLPERDGVNGHYGICYDDGEIRIRLRHAKTGRMLKESSLVDTLCHELAHLAHMNHGLRFRRLYNRILDDARALGIYRPGPDQDARPRQGSLFDSSGCGTARR